MKLDPSRVAQRIHQRPFVPLLAKFSGLPTIVEQHERVVVEIVLHPIVGDVEHQTRVFEIVGQQTQIFLQERLRQFPEVQVLHVFLDYVARGQLEGLLLVLCQAIALAAEGVDDHAPIIRKAERLLVGKNLVFGEVHLGPRVPSARPRSHRRTQSHLDVHLLLFHLFLLVPILLKNLFEKPDNLIPLFLRLLQRRLEVQIIRKVPGAGDLGRGGICSGRHILDERDTGVVLGVVF